MLIETELLVSSLTGISAFENLDVGESTTRERVVGNLTPQDFLFSELVLEPFQYLRMFWC